MNKYIPTFHHIVYELGEDNKFRPAESAEPKIIPIVLSDWQKDLREIIKKGIKDGSLTCGVCNGAGFLYTVTQVGTQQVRYTNFNKDVKYKMVTITFNHKGITYKKTQNLPYLENSTRYKIWGGEESKSIVNSLILSAFKYLPQELNNLLGDENPLRPVKLGFNYTAKSDSMSYLLEAKNYIQLLYKIEDLLKQTSEKFYINPKKVDNYLSKLKDVWSDPKIRTVIKKCPYCHGYGVFDIGHSDDLPSHSLFYKIAMVLLRKATSEVFDFNEAKRMWLEKSLQTVKIEPRSENIKKVQQDIELTQKSRKVFIAAYKKKFGDSISLEYYPTPYEIFSTKKNIADTTKKLLIRNKFREELKNEILQMLKNNARISNDKRVKRHMVESLKASVEEVKGAPKKIQRFGSSGITQLTFTAQHWKTRFTGIPNRKNPHYAKFYSDWSGEQRKPWSKTGLTIKEIIEQAFETVWEKYYGKKFPTSITINDVTYTRDQYLMYIRVFGEDYG